VTPTRTVPIGERMTGSRLVHPSRSVTRPRCVTCGRTFISRRADARYCSGRCRQRANRARQISTDIDREIQAARTHYWDLIRRKAEARGVAVSQVLTAEAQTVTPDGQVFMNGKIGDTSGAPVGTVAPLAQGQPGARPGWTVWGLEAAGPPFSPPMEGSRRPLARPRLAGAAAGGDE
jgi:hypothetical protein